MVRLSASLPDGMAMAKMTSTEKRIARLWKAGRTSQEIASEIGMNERMVRAILDDLNLG